MRRQDAGARARRNLAGLTWPEHTEDCAARRAVEGRAARRVGLGYGQLRGRREQGERGGVPTEDVVLADIFLLRREAPLLRRSNVADGQPWSA